MPLYVLIYKMHLYDTLFALILTHERGGRPDLGADHGELRPGHPARADRRDAGRRRHRVDGLPPADRPLSRPVLATLAIYNGLNVWNNFLLPLVLTQSNSVAVLPLGLTKLEGLYAINVPAVMAGVLLSVLPLVVLFIVMRRQVMRSLGSVVMR